MTGAAGLCGGIATANLNVLHALVQLVKEVDGRLAVMSLLEQPSDRPGFLPDDVEFHAFAGKKVAFSSGLLRYITRQPLICFDHVTLALPMLPFAAAGIVKTVIFAHGSEAWKRVRMTSRLSFRFATLTLTNSDFTLRKMHQRLKRFHSVACPLGLSPEFEANREIPLPGGEVLRFEAADGESRDLGDQVLLLVARMHPGEREKGQYELLEVLPRMLERYPDVQLVFAGPGDDRKNLADAAMKKHVAHCVFLPGRVTHQQLESLYRHCFAYVMPSKQEGFGLVHLEAMNCGKPCVGCRNDGAADVIVHGETGMLVADPTDRAELTAVLTELLDAPVQAAELGRNGFQRLHEMFTAEHYQQRVKEQLQKVVTCG